MSTKFLSLGGCSRVRPQGPEAPQLAQYKHQHGEPLEVMSAAQALLEEFADTQQKDPLERTHLEFLRKLESEGWLEVWPFFQKMGFEAFLKQTCSCEFAALLRGGWGSGL